MTQKTITIGQYLCQRLAEVGCDSIIGVPGDFNLPLLEEIERCDTPRFVGTCNELNAGYAADGYGRIKGISALLTTYGVGELSAINAVAGAYAEHIPMVVITGTPDRQSIRKRIPMHHTLGDGNYENMYNCHREFTVAQAHLTVENAAREIDRLIVATIQHKRPVYMQIPADISYLMIEAPKAPLNLTLAAQDTQAQNAAIEKALSWINGATKRALLYDRDVMRYNLEPQLLQLIEKGGLPFANHIGAKCALSEEHPLWLGNYVGGASAPHVKEGIEEAEVLIAVAPLFDDISSALFTYQMPEKTIYIYPEYIEIEGVQYEGINLHEVIDALIEGINPSAIEHKTPLAEPQSVTVTPKQNEPLTQNYLWNRLRGFFREGDVVLMDNGASSAALEEIQMPKNSTYVGQQLWASIGFALPATLGTLLAAPERRNVLFIGDGAFQLTAQELSTILGNDLKPIIFLINNRGYTIERFILGKEARFNNVANWDYSALPALFTRSNESADIFIAGCESSLEEALLAAEESDKLVFIELLLEPLDAPEGFEEVGYQIAEYTYGPFGPRP